MAIQLHNPATIAPPFSCYSHGASAPAGARWLYVSGQVGVTPESHVPDDPAKQIALAWDNLLAVLADAGMSVTDLVKVEGFITRPDMVPLYRKERERRFSGHAAATTLVIVAGLAEPNLLVEIQAVAAAWHLGGAVKGGPLADREGWRGPQRSEDTGPNGS